MAFSSPVVPVGRAPCFGADVTQLQGTHAAKTKKAVTTTKLAKSAVAAQSPVTRTAIHDTALKASRRPFQVRTRA